MSRLDQKLNATRSKRGQLASVETGVAAESLLDTSRRGVLLGAGMASLAALSGCASSSPVAIDLADTSHSDRRCEDFEASQGGIAQYLEQFTQPLPVPVAASEAVLKVESANLWYRDTGGSGEVVVLIHPTNLSGKCWGYQERAFAQAGYRVISYSRRGYQGSEVGVDGDSNDAVDDLRDIIDSLQLGHVHLVSSAGGGAVAVGYAARWPDDRRIASLVVACSLPYVEKSNEPGGKPKIPAKFLEFRGMPMHLLGLGTSYRDANPEGVKEWQAMNAQLAGKDGRAGTRRQSNGAISSLKEFEQIKAPTLYLAGSADLFCTPVLMQSFAEHTPISDIKVMNGVGHTGFWEAPNTFNARVTEHISRFKR